MRIIILFSVALLAFTSLATAQIPTSGNVFLGYSHVSADVNLNNRVGLNGWNGSLEGKVLPWVGIVADISGTYGSHDYPIACPAVIIPGQSCSAPNTAIHNVLFGPRVSVPIGRFTPFAHALFGVSHIHISAGSFSNSDTSFGYALGGGVDYRIIHGIGWRVQLDELRTRFFGQTQGNIRFSTGVALHF